VRSLIFALLASAAVAGLSPMPALAGNFSISPIRLDLSASAQTAALTVRNNDGEVLVQAQVLLWEQHAGEDRLTPTRDLLVSPAVFTVPKDGSQLVRVALRGAPSDPARELSYRLILQEVPQPANPDFSGMQVALRLSIPIFVANAEATGPALAWSAATSGDGLIITAQNAGDVHARILGFSIAPALDDGAALSQPVATYILPGQTQSWTLRPATGSQGSAAEWRHVRLTVTTDDGESKVELDTTGD
jgi:fimbrial chaperone protein